MKKHIYIVTADVKTGGVELHYVVNVSADNQKEAIQVAKAMWNKVNHLFHIKARQLEAHEEVFYCFWKQYTGTPRTKSRPEEAHVKLQDTAPQPEAADEPQQAATKAETSTAAQEATNNEPEAAADNAETEQVTTEAAEKPALVRNVENLICTAMYGWCTSLNAYCVAAGYFGDANGKAAYQEAQQAFAELQRMGYTDVQISALHTMRKPEWIDATAAGQPAPQEDEPDMTAESNAKSETTPKLELKRLENAKFGFSHRYVNFTGWALYDKERGYVAFSAQRDKHGILIPYFPQGGKKALQAILNQGGFANYDGIEFVTPIAS